MYRPPYSMVNYFSSLDQTLLTTLLLCNVADAVNNENNNDDVLKVIRSAK